MLGFRKYLRGYQIIQNKTPFTVMQSAEFICGVNLEFSQNSQAIKFHKKNYCLLNTAILNMYDEASFYLLFVICYDIVWKSIKP